MSVTVFSIIGWEVLSTPGTPVQVTVVVSAGFRVLEGYVLAVFPNHFYWHRSVPGGNASSGHAVLNAKNSWPPGLLPAHQPS